METYEYYGDVVAHLDTSAKVTVTNLPYILHDYKPYTKLFKCLVHLIGAVDGSNAVYPKGEGYLDIPVEVNNCYFCVKCYYSPCLTSTLLSGICILKQNDNPPNFSGQALQKDFAINDDFLLHHISSPDPLPSKPILYDYKKGTFTFTCHHKPSKSCNIVLRGSICSGQCYTQPLRLPDLPADNPDATKYNSRAKAKEEDPIFVEDIKLGVLENTNHWQQLQYKQLMNNLETIPSGWHDKIPYMDHIMELTLIQVKKSETKKAPLASTLRPPS